MIDYTRYGIKFPSQQEKLNKHYKNLDEGQFFTDIKERPYHIFCDILDMSFAMADKTVMQYKLVAPNARHRCQYAVYAALKTNEAAGNTRMTDSAIAQYVHGVAPESMSHIVDVVKTDELIHYDEHRHLVSFKRTYNAEVKIADNIKSRLAKPEVLNIDVDKYEKIDGNELTDEQMTALCMARDNAVCMINGSAGCVDCDTEFFNGFGWKKISDYVNGDKVLQYNKDGSATLVEPLAYIKKPANYLWHFETKYGVNQTVCNDHRIVYWSPKMAEHECRISDIIDKQMSKNSGWTGKFKTSFNYGGVGIKLSNEQIRVMCAVICDGSFYKNAKETSDSFMRCRFHIKKERKKERLRLLFNDAQIKWKEVSSAEVGYTDFYVNAPLRTKVFDSYWYDCNQEQLGVICDEIMFWDGNINTTRNGVLKQRFSTTVKETADFIQFAFSACGKRATITKNNRVGQKYETCGLTYKRKSIEYSVCVSDNIFVGICADNRKNHIKTMPQKAETSDGYKYCFTVPSHMLVLRRKDCIFVTGNCGKSFTTKAVVDMLEDNGLVVQLLAPTGIAAKVLRNYTHHPASTIHLYLTSVADCDVILIDEMSMVSVHLLSMLLTAVKSNPRLIFVADNAQLASISCGNIVQDMIDSGIVPRVELTKIFRYNTSGIVTLATDTRHGSVEHLTEQYPDYQFIQTGDDPIAQTVGVYDGLLAAGHSMDDVLVLCPFNKHIGCDAINKQISDEHNKNAPVRKNSNLKLGDKVINIKNDYGAGLVNGDIGYLRRYSYNRVTRAHDCVAEFDGWQKKVPSLDRLKQAYAISIHRIQGSSANTVILLIDKSHAFFLSKNLLYTAVTRARKKLIIIGDMDSITEGLKVSEQDRRDTWLKELLNERKCDRK